MVYRSAVKKECNVLTELRIAYLQTDYGELTVEQMNILRSRLPKYYEEHLNKDLFIYVAEDQDKIVGTVYLQIIYKPENPSFLTGKIGEVLSVYTDKEYRRRGIATTLMKLLLKKAEEMELSYVELEASEDGYPVYKSLGFKEHRNRFTTMRYKWEGR